MEEALEQLEEEYTKLQYLIAFMLHEAGREVFVSEKTMIEVQFENTEIRVEPSEQNDGAIVRLVDIDE